MPIADEWLYVDHFTVDQAAALWCDIDPSSFTFFNKLEANGSCAAIKQLIVGAIMSGALPYDASANPVSRIGNHSETLVTREGLRRLAEAKGQRPHFLFDTVLPATSHDVASSPSDPAITRSRGGRPVEYDWDGCIAEIVRIADVDGLPGVQARVLERLQEWFQRTQRREPAPSEIKKRIAPIYDALKRDGWKPKDG